MRIYTVAVFSFLFLSLISVSGQTGVGINTNNPRSTLDINGSLGLSVSTVTSSVTLDSTYGFVLCNNGATPITITLPNGSNCPGRMYNIKREASSSANVTISGTIDGVSGYVLKNPNEAIMVFCNGTEWKTTANYFSSSNSSANWTTTGNTGITPGTNFLGTKDNKDLLIKTNDSTRIKTTGAGETSIGDVDAGNRTTFEEDGTLKFEGEATVWDDITVFPDATGKGSTNAPAWAAFKNDGGSPGTKGTYIWTFASGAEQEVFFSVQMPHSYKEGTTLHPHVHWTTMTGTPGNNVVWSLEYTISSIGNTFPNTSTVSGNTLLGIITPSGTNQHLITPLSTISGTGIGISTFINCRLYRNVNHASDTFPNVVGFLGFDIHFEKDMEGSRLEYIK